jgi:hypothetical protein
MVCVLQAVCVLLLAVVVAGECVGANLLGDVRAAVNSLMKCINVLCITITLGLWYQAIVQALCCQQLGQLLQSCTDISSICTGLRETCYLS